MNFNFYAYANKQFCNTGTILKDSIPSAKVQINLQFARIYPYLTPKFRLFDQLFGQKILPPHAKDLNPQTGLFVDEDGDRRYNAQEADSHSEGERLGKHEYAHHHGGEGLESSQYAGERATDVAQSNNQGEVAHGSGKECQEQEIDTHIHRAIRLDWMSSGMRPCLIAPFAHII